MTITLCDACGKDYKKYSKTESGEGSALSIFSRNKEGKVVPSLKIDLCPDCMESVWQFIREDLMKPSSMRYDEICGTDGGEEDGEIGQVVASSEEE